MKRIIWLLLVLLVVGFQGMAQSAATGGISGNELLTKCNEAAHINKQQNNWEIFQSLQCMSYLEGFIDGYRMAQWTNGKTGIAPDICIPEKATLEQLAKIVVKWLENNPEDLHKQAKELTFSILYTIYPCPDKKSEQ